MHDVIVVGGGISGLVAAREITATGRSVVLLEGATRLGGRIRTLRTPLGVPVELGATWAHWSHPHLWSELTRYGIPFVPDVPVEQNYVRSDSGFIVESTRDDYQSRLQSLLERLFDPCMDFFSNPYAVDFTSPEFAQFDSHTISSWMDHVEFTQSDRDFVSGLFVALSGVPAEQAGISTFAHWWSFGGGTTKGFLDTFEGGRLQDGMGSLVDAVAASLSANIRLDSRVSAVDEHDDLVEVVTEKGDRFSARAVVFATPMNTWSTVDFSPALPSLAVQASLASNGGAIGGHAVIASTRGSQSPSRQLCANPTLSACCSPSRAPTLATSLRRTATALRPVLQQCRCRMSSMPWAPICR